MGGIFSLIKKDAGTSSLMQLLFWMAWWRRPLVGSQHHVLWTWCILRWKIAHKHIAHASLSHRELFFPPPEQENRQTCTWNSEQPFFLWLFQLDEFPLRIVHSLGWCHRMTPVWHPLSGRNFAFQETWSFYPTERPWDTKHLVLVWTLWMWWRVQRYAPVGGGCGHPEIMWKMGESSKLTSLYRR